jgi:phosphoglycerol transferase MdoB-like AlkP superfamily enzyme
VESLSAQFLGAYGSPRGLTPELDLLAAGGLLFSRVYATGTRTVRGLEALSLGTPPIPGQAIVRRPDNDHLATLGEILRRQGYESLFLYGGYGYFDNMNAFFAGNDYRVVDRTAFPKASIVFANIWGVADESLYANALVELDRAQGAGKPFLAHIMTTSNHRPYSYPDGRIDIPSPGGRDGAVKYTDYAIGRFIAAARDRAWFKDTLFVITADHCASAAGKTRLPVKGYHIPLILYAPALLKPGRNDRLTSQLDIPPTLLDVLGKPGDDHFFGKSVFEQDREGPRAFISNYQELGYYKDDLLTVLGPKKRVEAYRIDPDSGEAQPAPADPRLVEEAVAYYQQAFHAFKQGELKLR